MMKKGIALITSLFFISMISLLILENIDYTELIHKENNADVINTQMLISIMDIERDIAKQLKKIKTNELNTWLDKYSKIQVPFDNHTNVKIHFNKLENIYSINDIGKGKSIEKNLEDFFLEADVNYYAFSSFVKDYMKDIGMRVTNSKQVNKIINDYKKSTRYEDIIKIENKLDFFNVTENDFFILCKIEFNIEGKKVETQFVYDKNNEKIKGETFEVIFK